MPALEQVVNPKISRSDEIVSRYCPYCSYPFFRLRFTKNETNSPHTAGSAEAAALQNALEEQQSAFYSIVATDPIRNQPLLDCRNLLGRVISQSYPYASAKLTAYEMALQKLTGTMQKCYNKVPEVLNIPAYDSLQQAAARKSIVAMDAWMKAHAIAVSTELLRYANEDYYHIDNLTMYPCVDNDSIYLLSRLSNETFLAELIVDSDTSSRTYDDLKLSKDQFQAAEKIQVRLRRGLNGWETLQVEKNEIGSSVKRSSQQY